MYRPDSEFTVYTVDEWWQDRWDSIQFGRTYDRSIPFFDQFHALFLDVPKVALFQHHCENASFCNFAFKSKNCYMVFGCVENEDCLYGHIVWQSKDCVECLYCYRSEWCMESIDCVGCYKATYSQECTNCSEIMFCYDCRGCNNCFGCTGLRQKEWYWFNEPVGQEQYQKNLEAIMPLTQDKITRYIAHLGSLKSSLIFPEYYGVNNESVSGNHLYFSKNTHYSFDAKECEDCRYIFTAQYFKDVYDASFCAGYCESSYNCLTIQNSQETICSHLVHDSYDMMYCDTCYQCKHCFGCTGLRRKEYCILNKQYSKEEYEQLKAEIIEHMRKDNVFGEFFPISHAPFAYNESIIQDYYPLSQREAEEQGYTWYNADKTNKITQATVPITIEETGDEVTKQLFACTQCKKNYRIIIPELEAYRIFNVPLSPLCPECRHKNRMARRGQRQLHTATCATCNRTITTAHTDIPPANLRCISCYTNEIE